MAMIIPLIIIGAAAGYIATRIMKIEASLPVTVLTGILGALIGGLILRFLLAAMGMMSGFVGAVLGSMLLIWLWQKYAPKS